MNCMVILAVFDVMLMSTVLARPDKTIRRSAKYILNMMSAPRSTIPGRINERIQAYVSGSKLEGQRRRINTGQELISERARPQDEAPQITTRRDFGVVHSDACLTKTEELNPKTYFNTEDDFLPASYRTTVCTGTLGQRGYPNCVYGILDCVTIKEDIPFMRMPRNRNCSMWYHEVIKEVPVGCQCMWPH